MAAANNGSVLLATAPARHKRANMTLHVSTDGGMTCPTSRRIYDGPSGYSSVVAITGAPGRIAVLFERDDVSLCTSGSSCKLSFAVVDFAGSES